MFDINVNALLETLPYMGRGMAGIFIVTAIIVVIVNALNNIPEKKSKKDKEEK